jgi:hypothetical protein
MTCCEFWILHSEEGLSLHVLRGRAVTTGLENCLLSYLKALQKVLFGNAVLASLMSGRKYDVIPQNGDLISSCGDTLRTLFTRPLWPPSMNWSSELLLLSRQLHRKCHLEGNWIPLGHLTCHEGRACRSCLAFCSIKTFWLHFHIP